jgi:hypothetical protein
MCTRYRVILEGKDISLFMLRLKVCGFTCQQIKGKFFPANRENKDVIKQKQVTFSNTNKI